MQKSWVAFSHIILFSFAWYAVYALLKQLSAFHKRCCDPGLSQVHEMFHMGSFPFIELCCMFIQKVVYKMKPFPQVAQVLMCQLISFFKIQQNLFPVALKLFKYLFQYFLSDF